MTTDYSYETAIKNSEKVSWKLDDIIGARTFDLSKNLLPEGLAGAQQIGFLKEAEKRKLNHIRAYTYAHLFCFVEEFILGQIMLQAQRHQFQNGTAMRALLRFAEEELKHQQLFEQTKKTLAADFGTEIEVIGGAKDVAKFVLGNSPFAVLLLTDMLEWMTQGHYLELFQDGRANLDPTYVNVLKAHWMEEAQHTKLDTLELSAMAEQLSLKDREAAVDQVLAIGGAFDGLLLQQVQLDVTSLERAVGRSFSKIEVDELMSKQHKSYRYTFLVTGLRHKEFQALVGELTEGGRAKLEAAAAALSS